MIFLGELYEKGHPEIPQDYLYALEFYKMAADKGNTKALINLGHLYKEGNGVPQDY